MAWTAVLLLAGVAGVQGYLKIGQEAGGRVVGLRWDAFPVRYFVTNRDVPGVTAIALREAVDHAFTTWGDVPGPDVAGAFVGFTGAEPSVDDAATVIGFQARPELDRTLGATTFTVEASTGRLLGADIFLNSAFDWSTAPAGLPSHFDVESVVVHEVGHLLGLSHSALGETEMLSNGRRRVIAKRSVMFPIAFPPGSIRDRSLTPDDEAGLLDVYVSSAGRRDAAGSLQGRVLRNGTGVYGAHVVAFNPVTGNLVGGFTLTERGDFVIGGLPAGMYVVRVEPLDDAAIDSFFDVDTGVDIDFRPTYASSLVAVPAGGGSARVDITVRPR